MRVATVLCEVGTTRTSVVYSLQSSNTLNTLARRQMFSSSLLTRLLHPSIRPWSGPTRRLFSSFLAGTSLCLLCIWIFIICVMMCKRNGRSEQTGVHFHKSRPAKTPAQCLAPAIGIAYTRVYSLAFMCGKKRWHCAAAGGARRSAFIQIFRKQTIRMWCDVAWCDE